MNRIVNSVQAIPEVANGTIKLKTKRSANGCRQGVGGAADQNAQPAGSACHEKRYADALAGVLPPIKTVAAGWFVYQNGTWKQTGREIFLPQAQLVLPVSSRTAKDAKGLLEHLEGRFQVPPDSLRGFHRSDQNGDVLINVANGVVRVGRESVAMEPHSPVHCFTQQMAAEFHPHLCPTLFTQILSEALPDPADRDVFQLCMGNFLLPDCRFEVALVCYGKGGNSKSTVAEAVAAAFGEDLIRHLSMGQICDHRSYYLPQLRHAGVNLGTELDAIDVDESANFKALVSGEAIEVRTIYGRPFTMKTSAKLWFLANSLPRFKNGTDAEARRMRFLHFNIPPLHPDVTLKGKLLHERDGVLNFVLEGLQRVLGMSSIPHGGENAKQVHERFKVSNDPIGAFVATYCELSPDASETKAKLRVAFGEFREDYGLNLDDDWFFRKLYERHPELRVRQVRTNGQPTRKVFGIAVTAPNHVA